MNGSATGLDTPPYCLDRSQEYHGFLEVTVRDDSRKDYVVRPGDASLRVEKLLTTVIGERGTAAYGLTEEAAISREEAILQIGADGWQALVREPKMTASAFVLMGGQFEDIVTRDFMPSRLAAAVNGELMSLVPDSEAGKLAESLTACGCWPTGVLERICCERELVEYQELWDENAGSDNPYLAPYQHGEWQDENHEHQDVGTNDENCQEDFQGSAMLDTAEATIDPAGGDGAAGPSARPQVGSVPESVRGLRRRLSRLILVRGACPEANALLEELRQLEQHTGVAGHGPLSEQALNLDDVSGPNGPSSAAWLPSSPGGLFGNVLQPTGPLSC